MDNELQSDRRGSDARTKKPKRLPHRKTSRERHQLENDIVFLGLKHVKPFGEEPDEVNEETDQC